MAVHTHLGSQPKLARASKVGQTTIGRILRGKNEPTVSMLEKIAVPFRLEAWQLLFPDLDPHHAPTKKELLLYKNLAQVYGHLLDAQREAPE